MFIVKWDIIRKRYLNKVRDAIDLGDTEAMQEYLNRYAETAERQITVSRMPEKKPVRWGIVLIVLAAIGLFTYGFGVDSGKSLDVTTLQASYAEEKAGLETRLEDTQDTLAWTQQQLSTATNKAEATKNDLVAVYETKLEEAKGIYNEMYDKKDRVISNLQKQYKDRRTVL